MWLHPIHLGNISFFLLLSIPFLFGEVWGAKVHPAMTCFYLTYSGMYKLKSFKCRVKKGQLVHGQDKLMCELKLAWAWCMEYSSFRKALLRAGEFSLSPATVHNDLPRLNSAKRRCCKLLMCCHFTFPCMNRANNTATCTVPHLWCSHVLYPAA